MRYLKDTTWQEIFAKWKQREGNNPEWISFATKVKGWPDWESWRRFSALQINAEQREWKIYEFEDPMQEIPEMLVGPFAGWQSMLPEKNKNTFVDLMNIPERYEHFKNHNKVVSMLESFPPDTEMIGFLKEDTGQVVCLEGSHRAATVAIAKKEGKKIDFKGKVRIALAILKKEEKDLLNKVLERGTTYKV